MRRSVAEEVDIFVDLLDDFQRQFRNQSAIRDQEDRNLFVAVTYAANNIERRTFFKLRVALKVPVEQDRQNSWDQK